MPNILPATLDYTNKDQNALERRLRSLIDVAFPTWTEHARANFGNILVGLFAFVGDQHSYYVDQYARESRISVAQLRRSLLGLVKLIDYNPASASAATTDATFSIPAANLYDVPLAAGTIVRTSDITDSIEFQLLEDTVIPAGSTSVDATVEHSKTHSESVSSDGLPNQTFRLRNTPFLDQSDVGTSPIITFANGSYTIVDNFLDSTATDRHATMSIDSNDRVTIFFGNGVNGAIPVGTGTIVYKTGGGAEGIVEPGAIRTVDGSFTNTNLDPVIVSVTNANAPSGGSPRESNAQIRLNAPKASRVLNRAIAREDFEIVAEQVSGVARALSITKNEDAAVAENALNLFIVPDGGGTASTALLDSVHGRFKQVTGQPAPTHPTLNTLLLQTLTASYLQVDHTIRASPAQGYTPAEMKTAIDTVLGDFYSVEITAARLIEIAPKVARANNITAADGTSLIQNPLVGFGFNYKDSDGDPTGIIPWSDIFNVIRDLPEVRLIDPTDGLLLNGLRDNVTIGTFKFPTIDASATVVIDNDTGATL